MCIVWKLYFGSKILRVYRYLYCVALPAGSAGAIHYTENAQ